MDFYSGCIYKALGFPTDMFVLLFTIPRMAGWTAHWYGYNSGWSFYKTRRTTSRDPSRTIKDTGSGTSWPSITARNKNSTSTLTRAKRWRSRSDLDIIKFDRSFFLVDFFQVESEFSAFEDVAVASARLPGPAGDAGQDSA